MSIDIERDRAIHDDACAWCRTATDPLDRCGWARALDALADAWDAADLCGGCGSPLTRCLAWHHERDGQGKCCPDCKHPAESRAWTAVHAALAEARDALAITRDERDVYLAENRKHARGEVYAERDEALAEVERLRDAAGELRGRARAVLDEAKRQKKRAEGSEAETRRLRAAIALQSESIEWAARASRAEAERDDTALAEVERLRTMHAALARLTNPDVALVEAVARAMCNAPGNGDQSPDWQDYVGDARAAIAALAREVTGCDHDADYPDWAGAIECTKCGAVLHDNGGG